MPVTQSGGSRSSYIPQNPCAYVDLDGMNQEDKEICEGVKDNTGYNPLPLDLFTDNHLGLDYEEFSGKPLRDIELCVITLSDKAENLRKRYKKEITKKYEEYLKSFPENMGLSVNNTRYIQKLGELKEEGKSLIEKAVVLGKSWQEAISEELEDYLTAIGPFLVGDYRFIHELHRVPLYVPKYTKGQSPEEIKENFEKNVEGVMERLETKKGVYEKELGGIKSELLVFEEKMVWFDENLEKFL